MHVWRSVDSGADGLHFFRTVRVTPKESGTFRCPSFPGDYLIVASTLMWRTGMPRFGANGNSRF